jgi:hypothetical protein
MDMASHEKMDQALEDGAKQAAIHLKTLEIEEEAGGDSGSGNGQVEEAEAGE